MADGYKTADEAVKAAYSETFPIAKNGRYEYLGLVYQKDGKYYYTSPVTSHQNGHVKSKLGYPKDAKLVAMYHTHTPGEHNGLFSRDDINMANSLKLPYYMGLPLTGEIKVFQPGKSKVEEGLLGRLGAVYSRGELFGALDVE